MLPTKVIKDENMIDAVANKSFEPLFFLMLSCLFFNYIYCFLILLFNIVIECLRLKSGEVQGNPQT